MDENKNTTNIRNRDRREKNFRPFSAPSSPLSCVRHQNPTEGTHVLAGHRRRRGGNPSNRTESGSAAKLRNVVSVDHVFLARGDFGLKSFAKCDYLIYSDKKATRAGCSCWRTGKRTHARAQGQMSLRPLSHGTGDYNVVFGQRQAKQLLESKLLDFGGCALSHTHRSVGRFLMRN